MIKIWLKADPISQLRYVHRWQVIDRKIVDNIAIDASRPQRKDILYIPNHKLPTKFFLQYKRYIVDDNNNIILGPKFYEKYPEKLSTSIEQSVLLEQQRQLRS
jgi:hypothetical protein